MWDRYQRGESKAFINGSTRRLVRRRFDVAQYRADRGFNRRSTAISPNSSGSWTKSRARIAGRRRC
jgi:hypothetical protein